MEREALYGEVIRTLADVLAVEPSQVHLDDTLQNDLGVESIDLMDVLFRLQRSARMKVSREDITSQIRESMPAASFADADGNLTEAGREALSRTLTQVPRDRLREMNAGDVFSEMTVRNLADAIGRSAGNGK